MIEHISIETSNHVLLLEIRMKTKFAAMNMSLDVSEYFSNYLKNIPIKATSHGRTQKRILSRIT